jgi:hypothetical protein
VSWLAARTGKDPKEITASPAAALSALSDALREVTALAARTESADPQVRAQTESELATLREQFASAPSASDVFMGKVAAALRDTAERLKEKPAES